MKNWIKENWLKGLIVLLAFFGFYWVIFKDDSNEIKSNKETKTEVTAKDQIIQNFIEQYHPNTNISSGMIYTFQFEDALVRADKPVIFTANLDDIFRKNGKFFIRFAPTLFDLFEQPIFYTLVGCEEKITEMASRKHDYFDEGEYVVVAKITSINKPIVKIDGSATGDENTVELDLSQTNTFLATGICLDLAYIDNAPVKK